MLFINAIDRAGREFHNHPSGDPTPSDPDIQMTRRIMQAAETMGIVVHDHLIIGKDRELSFRASGLL